MPAGLLPCPSAQSSGTSFFTNEHGRAFSRRSSAASSKTFSRHSTKPVEDFVAPVISADAFANFFGFDSKKVSPQQTVEQINDIAAESSVIVADTKAVEEVHQLADSWTVWEQSDDRDGRRSSVSSVPRASVSSICSGRDSVDFASKCSEIKTFDTIEGMMELYNGMVPPSAIIKKNHIVRKQRGSILGKPDITSVDAYAFFKDGIAPTWEDPAHKDGGMFQFTFKTDFSAQAMDEIWERLLFTIIGNGMPGGESITGIRMADRHPNKVVDAPIIAVRIEVWRRELPHEQDLQLRKNCINCIKESLSCGGTASAHRTVRKGAFTTKTAFTYKPAKAQVTQQKNRRGSV